MFPSAFPESFPCVNDARTESELRVAAAKSAIKNWEFRILVVKPRIQYRPFVGTNICRYDKYLSQSSRIQEKLGQNSHRFVAVAVGALALLARVLCFKDRVELKRLQFSYVNKIME